jgi:hypothetical protein
LLGCAHRVVARHHCAIAYFGIYMKLVYIHYNKLAAWFIGVSLAIFLSHPLSALSQDRRGEKSRFGIGIGYDFLRNVNLSSDEKFIETLRGDFQVESKLHRKFAVFGRVRYVVQNRLALGLQIESLTYKTDNDDAIEIDLFPGTSLPKISIHERANPIYFDAGVRLASSGQFHLWLGGSITSFHVEREVLSDIGGLLISEQASATLPSYRIFGEIEVSTNRLFSLWFRGGYRFAEVDEFDDSDRPVGDFVLDFSGVFINLGLQIDNVW